MSFFKKQKRQRVFVFIDSQNLNLGTSKSIFRNKKLIYKGWKLDFKKFRMYLVDKFRVEKAFLFIGYIKKKNKLFHIIIPNRHSESTLLKSFQKYKIFLYREKQRLEFMLQ